MQWWENIKFEISSIMLPTTQLQHERSTSKRMSTFSINLINTIKLIENVDILLEVESATTPNLWFTTKPSKVKFRPNVNVINVKLTNIRLTLGVNFYVDVS